MSDIINSNIQMWRMKASTGELTEDEMREAIAAIRRERGIAMTTSATSRTKKAEAAAPIDGEALLAGFM